MTIHASLVRKDGSVTWVELPANNLMAPYKVSQPGSDGKPIFYKQLSLTRVETLVAVYVEEAGPEY